MKKTVRNLMIGTTALLGVSYMIKKITKMKDEKNIAEEPKIEEDVQLPTYHTLGVILKENGRVKVKEIKKTTDSKEKVV